MTVPPPPPSLQSCGLFSGMCNLHWNIQYRGQKPDSQSVSVCLFLLQSNTFETHKFSFFASFLAETQVSTWKTAAAIINLLLERKKFPPLLPKMSLTWKDWEANKNRKDTKRQKPQDLQKSSTDKWLEIHWRLSKTLIHLYAILCH